MPNLNVEVPDMVEILKSKRTLLVLASLIFFGFIFILNTFAVSDGDYFWHVNSGQWIWEHRALPVSDPFSFPVEEINPYRPESGRIAFILKQYWLGQLVMSSLWQMWGEASIVVLRAFIHAGLILAIFFVSWRRSDFYRAFILGVLTLCQFQTLGNERPVIFTFLFAFLLIWLLERITDSCRPLTKPVVVGLPLVMLVWANIHGGYIFGLCLIAAYVVGFGFEKFRSFDRLSGKRILLLLGAGLAATANPAGFPELLTGLFAVQSGYASQVMETKNTIQYFLDTKHLSHPYIPIVLLTILSLIASFRKMRPAHIVAIGGVLILSLLAVRYEIFLFLIAPLMVAYLPFPTKQVWAVLITIALLFFPFLGTNFQKPLVFEASSSFPSAAVEFMRETKLAPNLFNYYDWGGYLANRAPEYKVFIDGRGLIEEHFDQHSAVIYKEDLTILDSHEINTAIFPIHNIVTGQVIPLSIVLSFHPDWEAVFVMDNSMIFLRNIQENKPIIDRYAIPGETLFPILIDAYDGMLGMYPDHYRALVTKAQLQERVGDYAGAINSLEKARAVNPESTYTKQTLQRLMRKKSLPRS